ncbi:HNH endonuclease [Candidatus Dojkabacteria bacterium]|jgi:5-methylcytosine-specific restriction endonuclease McrA|nr:HNH endonuclease [Candidatus Dojkabacteria bacterium]
MNKYDQYSQVNGEPIFRKTDIGYPKNNLCQMCGMKKKLTRHHIIPKSCGGSNSPINIEWICRPCHDIIEEAMRKGNANPRIPDLYF